MTLLDLNLVARVGEVPSAQANFDEILRRWRDIQVELAAGVAATALKSDIAAQKAGLFSVYKNASQSLAVGSSTALLFDQAERNNNSWYDGTTGKYTPLVAGNYRLSAGVGVNQVTASGTRFILSIFKNGASHKRLAIDYSVGGDANLMGNSVQVAANGTTDFFTVVLEHNLGVALATASGPASMWFSGEFVSVP